jgi:type II restriction enzyme
MSHKDQLRTQRQNTVINVTSKEEDKQCIKVIDAVLADLQDTFHVKFEWQKKIMLTDIVESLRKNFPNVSFGDPLPNTYMSPDGGITFLIDRNGGRFPFLIAEVKNQGTNDAREREGLKKQAKGNAVERLGKNVIGFRAYMLNESIFPFVCFGDGCDFEEKSTINDRILTISMFGELNRDHTANTGPNNIFNRGSYYFRYAQWTPEEMYDILYDVGERALYYYFSKYGESSFRLKR